MKVKTDLWIMSHAMFLDWIKLQTLLEYRLNALLHREIEAIPFQDGDYWDVEITPVSVEEMELLLDIAKADEEDRKNHLEADWTRKSLTDAFSQKLLAPELPFPIKTTVSTEGGVYFIGQDIPYYKLYQPKEDAHETE